MTDSPKPRTGQPILFKDGIVLTMDDARTVVPRGDVLVRDGKIAEVGVDVPAPDDAFVIDASGIVRYAHRSTAGLTFRPTEELLAAVEAATVA